MATATLRTSYSKVKSSYESRPVNPFRLQAILDCAGSSILEAGCGNGQYVFALKDEYDIHGVDISAFDTWQGCPERFSIADVTRLPHSPATFDTITCFEVLEHVPDPGKVVRDFYRICRQNLILTVPNCDITPAMRASLLIYHHYIDPTHVNFFQLDSITELCRQAGFRIRHAGYINRMNLFPLIEEAFDFSGWRGKRIQRWLNKSEQKPYNLTCLVVAEK